MLILRTPDYRFADLADYPFSPNYTVIQTEDGNDLRIHHLDEGLLSPGVDDGQVDRRIRLLAAEEVGEPGVRMLEEMGPVLEDFVGVVDQRPTPPRPLGRCRHGGRAAAARRPRWRRRSRRRGARPTTGCRAESCPDGSGVPPSH